MQKKQRESAGWLSVIRVLTQISVEINAAPRWFAEMHFRENDSKVSARIFLIAVQVTQFMIA